MDNIKKDVWLAIHSTQHFEGCEPEQIDLMTEARLYRRNGKYYISYEESELTGLEDTRTTVKIAPEGVTMIRSGKYPSEMLFLENQRHVGLYQTEYGQAMTISTHTSHIRSTIGPEGGMLALDYSIEVDNNLAGEHHFEMLVATEPFAEV